ncbi:hypothetical protein [Streptomyces collinus]|uniref:hypothetical protein n=1 Tax=Streptomyces collinus TaxID=42684 RepID=UPI0036EA5047
MSKLIRRCAVTGASAVAAAGALLAVGGPASAATPLPASPGSAATAAADHPASRPPDGHSRVDPWVAGQVAWFDPAAARRLAIYDPWVKDQLARFTSHGG